MKNGHHHNINGSPGPNYIKIINWAWETLPFTKDCKTSHIVLFFAILDSINKNKWTPTRLPYEFMLNKCKISKETYLSCRKWLIDHNFIVVESGKNGYQMASFFLGSAVGIKTSIYNIEAGNKTADNTADSTGKDSKQLLFDDMPAGNKTGNPTHLKTVNNINTKQINIPFETFWNLYDKKRGKDKCEILWNKLTDEERQQAINYLPSYIASTPDIQYRKDPATFLRNKSFNDQLIGRGKFKQFESIPAYERVAL